MQREIAARNKGISTMQAGVEPLQQGAAGTRAAMETANTNALVAQSGLEVAKERAKAAAACLAAFDKKYENYANFELLKGDGPFGSEYAQNLHDQAVRPLAPRLLAKSRIWQARSKTVAAKETAASEAKAEYQAALEALTERLTAITKGQEVVSEKTAELAATKAANAAISKAQLAADGLKLPAGQIASADVAAAAARARGGRCFRILAARPLGSRGSSAHGRGERIRGAPGAIGAGCSDAEGHRDGKPAAGGIY